MKKRRMRWFFAVVMAIALLGAALLIVSGFDDRLTKVDVAVVLGNAVEYDGHPSVALQARLDKTIQLYREGYFSFIFASGGVGKEGYDEAIVMKKYLVEHSIPSAQIIVDSEGNTTFLTAKHAACIMRVREWKSAMVISQYFHIARSRLALSRFGISHVGSAHASLFLAKDIYSLCRELAGYVYYFFRSYPADPCS